MKKTILILSILFVASSASGQLFSQNQKAAVVDLSGTITPSESTGFGSVSGINPEQVRDLNRKALNQDADVIIYEINSGGGAVVASKEIYRSIDDVSVPTVCRMRDVAASGGYLISLGCDRIVADESTLTGSIGVKSSYIQYSGTLDKIGAKYVNISAGENKELANPFMNTSEQEKEILQKKISLIHDDFLSLAEKERNLTRNELEKIDSGEPFLGEEAKELSLIDRLGGREAAIDEAENMTDKDLKTFKVEEEPGFDFLSLLTADMNMNLDNLLGFSSPFRAAIGY
jgi:protease-4